MCGNILYKQFPCVQVEKSWIRILLLLHPHLTHNERFNYSVKFKITKSGALNAAGSLSKA